MRNKEIRKKISDAGLHFWEIAETVGIHPATLCHWFRQELKGERLTRVEDAIDALIQGGMNR